MLLIWWESSWKSFVEKKVKGRWRPRRCTRPYGASHRCLDVLWVVEVGFEGHRRGNRKLIPSSDKYFLRTSSSHFGTCPWFATSKPHHPHTLTSITNLAMVLLMCCFYIWMCRDQFFERVRVTYTHARVKLFIHSGSFPSSMNNEAYLKRASISSKRRWITCWKQIITNETTSTSEET